MKEKKGLLDEIMKFTGSLYLSDLHGSLLKSGVKDSIKEIEVGKYTDKEWREAYNYISGEKISTDTEEEIRERFKK